MDSPEELLLFFPSVSSCSLPTLVFLVLCPSFTISASQTGLFFGITWEVYDILGLGSISRDYDLTGLERGLAPNALKAPQVCLWVLKA